MRPARARAWALVACVAAAVATAGDLAMLWVVNARRPDLALPEGPAGLLQVGCWLGVVSIPLYGLGYAAAATLVDESRRRTAHLVTVCGVIGGLTGGIIHGLTARVVAARIAAGAPALGPFAELSSAPELMRLWSVATFGVVVASLAFSTGVRAKHGAALAGMNPVLVTVALSLVSVPAELTRSFLAPAAPNLAHVVFFGMCCAVLARGGHSRSPRSR